MSRGSCIQVVCGTTMRPNKAQFEQLPEFESWIMGKTYDDLVVWIENHRLAIAKTCEDALLLGRPALLRQREMLCIELEWIDTTPEVGLPRFKLVDVILRDVHAAVARYYTVPIKLPDAEKRVAIFLERPIALGHDGMVTIIC